MNRFRWLIWIGILCFIVSETEAQGPSAQDSSKDSRYSSTVDSLKNKNPTSAMLRSIFVPGWGQFYNGKWFKGVVIAGVEIGLIANAIVLNQWANEAATEEEYLFFIDNRNLSFWLLGAAILYSMADAFVDAHLANFDESPDLSLLIRKQQDLWFGSSATILSIHYSFHF